MLSETAEVPSLAEQPKDGEPTEHNENPDEAERLNRDPENVESCQNTDYFQEPTKEMILNFVNENHVRDPETGEKLPFWSTDIREIFKDGDYTKSEGTRGDPGPGLSSYFHFLVLYSVAFLIFGVLMTPSLVFNFMIGSNFKGVARFSLGNLFRPEDLVETNVSQTYEFGKNDNLIISRRLVAYVEVFLDVVVTILFLCLTEYSKLYFKKQQFCWEVGNPKLEHFTIEVRNLPKKASYEELKIHFTKLVEKARKAREYERLKHPEENKLDFENKAENGKYVADPIADIQIVTTTRKNLSFALKLSASSRNAEAKEAKFILARRKRDEGMISDARFSFVSREYEKALNNLRTLWEKRQNMKSESDRTVKCFITFAQVRDKLGVLALYHKSSEYKRIYEDIGTDLRMGDKKLNVNQAAAPSLLKWEHMEYRTISRYIRACVSIVLVALTLLLCIFLLVAISKAKKVDLFSVFNEQQQKLVSNLDCSSEFIINNSNISAAELIGENGECYGVLEIDDTVSDLCVQAFFCFCKSIVNARNSVCSQLLVAGIEQSLVYVGAAFLVNLFNIFLQFLILRSVKFERTQDRSSERKKQFIRLFCATYMNTGFVTLLAGLNYHDVFGIEIPLLPEGKYSDFTSEWYNEIGSEIVFIGLINIFSPHAFLCASYCLSQFKRAFVKPISKHDIKKTFLGPRLLLPVRHSQALVSIFLAFTYSPGIPILYFIASASLCVQFLVDKYLSLNFYRSPPMYTNEIAVAVCDMMKFGIIIHFAFSLLMFSEKSIFPFQYNFMQTTYIADGETIPLQRVFGEPVIMILIVVVLLLFVLVLKEFQQGFNLLLVLWRKVNNAGDLLAKFCYGKQRKEIAYDSIFQIYSELDTIEALRNNMRLENNALLGIRSYNILANPLYASKLYLRNNKTFNELVEESGIIHSTADVITLLDTRHSRKRASLVLERSLAFIKTESNTHGNPK